MSEDAFDSRKESQEAKFKMDEERRFKIRARRNKLFGLWAAERMGLSGDAAEAYARGMVMAGMETAGDQALIGKAQSDLDGKGLGLGEALIARELTRLHELAGEQIAREFPRALDKDHRRVGD